jgi:hypothetical protein
MHAKHQWLMADERKWDHTGHKSKQKLIEFPKKKLKVNYEPN